MTWHQILLVEMTGDEMTLNVMTLWDPLTENRLSLEEPKLKNIEVKLTVDRMIVDIMTVSKMNVGTVTVGKMSVDLVFWPTS